MHRLKKRHLFVRPLVIFYSLIKNPTVPINLSSDTKPNCDTHPNLIMKDISGFTASAFSAGSSVPLQINNSNFTKILHDAFPKTVECLPVYERVIADEGDDAVLLNP